MSSLNSNAWEETKNPQWPKYLNVYKITQGYGGPEEGGWWYDCGEPLESVCVDNDAELKNTLVRLEQRYEIGDKSRWSRERKRGKSSCAGGYNIEIRTEDKFAEAFPQHRPYYE